jgi:hypothetical protein
MPALPPATQVCRIIVHQALQDDNNVINRFFIKYTGSPPTDAMLNTFCAAVGTAWGANVSPLQSSNITAYRAETEDLTSATSAVGAANFTEVGTRAGATLSASVAAVINGIIARRYRGGHPKNFLWAGIETDLQTVGTWKATFTAAVEAGWLAFIDAVLGAGWAGAGTLTPVNVSYYAGFHNFTFPSGRTRPIPTVRVAPVVDPITEYTVRAIIGSQRRRNQ